VTFAKFSICTVTFIFSAVPGIYLIQRWLNKKAAEAEAERRDALDRDFEDAERDLAFRREVIRINRFLEAVRLGFVRVRVIEPRPGDTVEKSDAVDDEPEFDGLSDDANAAIDAALGPLQKPPSPRIQAAPRRRIGPEFARPDVKSLADGSRDLFQVLETRSGSTLTVDNRGIREPGHWVFCVWLKDAALVGTLARPESLLGNGPDWTTTVCFSQISEDEVELAVAALEAWFIRLASRVGAATGGRLTQSVDRSALILDFPGYPGCL